MIKCPNLSVGLARLKKLTFLVGINVFASLCLITDLNAKNLTASWYDFSSCRKEGTSGYFTASGERFNENDMTCAMRSRDFGGYYRVTNLANGKSVVVQHNDYGPSKKLWQKGRIIDLSRGAFQKIAQLKEGVIPVRVEKI